MEEQLWLAPWHFFILVLNRGQLKNHPVVCVVLHSCELQRQFVLAAEIIAFVLYLYLYLCWTCVALYSCKLQRQFVAPIALAAEILAAKRFGTAASFAWTHFGSFNPTYFG